MAQQMSMPEDEIERKAGALKTISLGLLATLGVAVVTIFVLWLLDRRLPIATVTMLEAIVLMLGLQGYWFGRRKKPVLGGYILVIGFLLFTGLTALLLGGATGPLAIIYIFPILVAGVVLGVKHSYGIAALASVFYLASIPVEQAGLLTPVFESGQTGYYPFFIAVWVLFFFLVAFLGWFASNKLQQALQNMRTYAGELQVAYEKLQASEEELRASNEELEAANEELRATEEELRASNEELREAQERLIRSEKLAAIGQLAGGVGHELRNPLGAIKNAVYYIRGKLQKNELAKSEPRVMDFLDIVDDEINSSNKIINDLLSFSRVGKPATSPARIEQVIDDAVARTAIPDAVELCKEPAAPLSEAEVDTDQMRQVLVNMITNSVQAMPDGGTLTIGARTEDGLMKIKVADTGQGIPEEHIGKIFDPLYTMKAKGIGLGLAVCKSIVERHGGNIEVTSKVGSGTIFTISLPLKQK